MILLYDSEDIVLTNDDDLFAFDLYCRARIISDDYFLALLNFHLDVNTVNFSARTYCNDLCDLRLLLSAGCKNDAALSRLLGMKLLDNFFVT